MRWRLQREMKSGCWKIRCIQFSHRRALHQFCGRTHPKQKKAAQVMKLTAQDLKELGIIEQILPEFPVVSSDNMNRVTLYMKRKIAGFLVKYQQMGGEELAEQRYQRFRGM